MDLVLAADSDMEPYLIIYNYTMSSDTYINLNEQKRYAYQHICTEWVPKCIKYLYHWWDYNRVMQSGSIILWAIQEPKRCVKKCICHYVGPSI